MCDSIRVNNLSASGNFVAVLIEHSDSCMLLGPWVSYNQYGGFVETSTYVRISQGMFYMNHDYAVYLSGGTSGCMAAENTFQYNRGAGDLYDPGHVQAYEDGSSNSWNDAYTGNYWQDWLSPDSKGDGIVDLPYELDGAAGSADLYPLTTPTQLIPEFGPAIAVTATIAAVAVAMGSARRRARA